MKNPVAPAQRGIPGVQKALTQASQLPAKRRRQLGAQPTRPTNVFANLSGLASKALKG